MFAAVVKQKVKKALPKSILEAFFYLKYFGQKLPNHEAFESHVFGKRGLEIGGPSILFKTVLPLYQKVGDLDGVNFSSSTVWEGVILPGKTFSFIGNRKGSQFVSDATDLSGIESESYDFVLSSNCLEHVANPIKALFEWRRVMRSSGVMVLVLPNKVSNFDHRRSTTTLAHIIDDYIGKVTEHDLTHLEEILELHDLSRDPPAGTVEMFRKRSLENFNNRTLHHHVFDLDLIKGMLAYAGFTVIEYGETKIDFFVLAKKSVVVDG